MRENYTLHKLHSLTGIVPVGFYLCQHLTLNTFALAGPEKFNSVIGFFESMPQHVLAGLKYGVVWLPLLFHAVYGVFISMRAEPNYTNAAYKWRENKYYTLQRISGIVAFFFLVYHMATTSVAAKFWGIEQTITYDNWVGKLTGPILGIPYLGLAIYVLGIVASTYHFSYGIWHFCIRWGITVSEAAQRNTAKVAQGAFVFLTLAGFLALVGFFNPILESKEHKKQEQVRAEQPLGAPMAPARR